MNRDIDSLSQAALNTPLEAPGLEPLTRYLNIFIAIQARESKVVIWNYADDIQVTDLVREYARQTLYKFNLSHDA